MLTPGTVLGAYEILSALGAGGMGEVYRARDTRLQRDVAIKILPDIFAADAERLARFEREAQVLASLNHPNIAQVFGIEEAGGVRALVMELVDGETLADRIARAPLPVDEALAIARQVADALEAAHDRGVIHRDLKPANISIRHDGAVKVLDFGLAKIVSPAGATGGPQTLSPTITSPVLATGVGVLLGTAAYMSPEQARGREADKRSDVWAFGCILYEMLTGRRAFEGEDVADTLALVLRGAPDLARLPASTPDSVRTLVTECLQKDPKARISNAGTARFLMTRAVGTSSAQPVSAERRFLNRRTMLGMAAALVIGAGLATALFAVFGRSPVATAPVVRFDIALGRSEQLTGAGRQIIALSPDGTHIVYSANDRLFLRSLNQLDAVEIRGTEAARVPFFSPDSQSIGFWQRGELKRVSVSGGAPVVICAAAASPLGVSWEADGTILFGQGRDGILRVAESGGTAMAIVKEPGRVLHGPQGLPGGKAILYTSRDIQDPAWSNADIVVRSLDSGRRTVVVHGGTDARYLGNGRLVYVNNGVLFALRFDPSTASVSGGPVSVLERVGQVPEGPTGSALFSVSRTGSLIYLDNAVLTGGSRSLVWVDRSGHEQPIAAPPRPYVYPRLSPDGTRLAVTVRDGDRDVWIWDLVRATLTRLTFDRADDRYAVWTPDSRRIIFSSNRGGRAGTWWQYADGTGTAVNVAMVSDVSTSYLIPTSIVPDGSRVILEATAAGGGSGSTLPDLLVAPFSPVDTAPEAAGAHVTEPQALLKTPAAERNGDLSPDGRWLAYESNESGRFEVYVRPFPNIDAGRWQISNGGGLAPKWSRDGRELYYVLTVANDPGSIGPTDVSGSAGRLMRVAVDAQRSFQAAPPQPLFAGVFEWTIATFGGRQYDVAPDGRFVMMKAVGTTDEGTLPRLVFIQNWVEELNQRMGGQAR